MAQIGLLHHCKIPTHGDGSGAPAITPIASGAAMALVRSPAALGPDGLRSPFAPTSVAQVGRGDDGWIEVMVSMNALVHATSDAAEQCSPHVAHTSADRAEMQSITCACDLWSRGEYQCGKHMGCYLLSTPFGSADRLRRSHGPLAKDRGWGGGTPTRRGRISIPRLHLLSRTTFKNPAATVVRNPGFGERLT